jgi:uncharacterized cupin superfamily protein
VSSVERVQNLVALALEDGPGEAPPGHDFTATSLTGPFGAVATGMGIYELEPGNASWPYHFEATEEEWLIVIEGELTLRTPAGETVLRAGAHAVRNHTDTSVRYAMPSTNARHGGASVYPDSGKVRVSGPGFSHRGRLGEPVGYWEGET